MYIFLFRGGGGHIDRHGESFSVQYISPILGNSLAPSMKVFPQDGKGTEIQMGEREGKGERGTGRRGEREKR